MLCTSGHNNSDAASFCSVCGVNTFHPATAGTNPGTTRLPVGAAWNAFAIASLVCSVTWLYWFGSILGIVFGFIARKQIRERGEQGAGLALAGIIVGAVALALAAVVFPFFVGLASNCSNGC